MMRVRKEVLDEIYDNSVKHDDVGQPRVIDDKTYVCVGWTHLKRDAEKRAQEFRRAGYLAWAIYEQKHVPEYQRHFINVPWGIWAYRLPPGEGENDGEKRGVSNSS